MKENVGKSFLIIGILFLLIGFVQQGFKVTFVSGLFNLGFIFTLSGLVTMVSKKKETKTRE